MNQPEASSEPKNPDDPVALDPSVINDEADAADKRRSHDDEDANVKAVKLAQKVEEILKTHFIAIRQVSMLRHFFVFLLASPLQDVFLLPHIP